MSFLNESGADRAIRIVLGLTMLAVGWSGVLDDLWGIAFRLFGWYPLITGVMGWCPLYVLLDLSTRRERPLGDSSRR